MLPTWLIIQPYEHMFWVKVGAFVAVFAGHCCSVFVECKGGKGVAASIGALLALAPWSCVIGLTLWLAVFLKTRYVSLASLIFSASLPLSAYVCGLPKSIQVFLWVLSTGIICMHKANIERLLRGEEPAFKRRFAQ
jgi:glycerol-3-phosphate acyltransferase PlsY